MQSFLKICYTWGEVYIMVTYYCNDQNINFVRTLDNDYASCNITYLHNYLKKEQWFMISQRITNFGEKPCKIIMVKIFTAYLIFKNNLLYVLSCSNNCAFKKSEPRCYLKKTATMKCKTQS